MSVIYCRLYTYKFIIKTKLTFSIDEVEEIEMGGRQRTSLFMNIEKEKKRSSSEKEGKKRKR